MTYTLTKPLTFDEFVAQYGNDFRYELADAEVIDMELGRSVKLVVEVVSTNWETDYARKLEEYALLGIPEYWIVDFRGLGGTAFIGRPKQPTLTVCTLDAEEYKQQYRLGEPISSPLLPTLKFCLDDVLPR